MKPKQWTHCVGTYDGKTAKLYINGSLAGQLKHAGKPISSSGYDATVQIGSSQESNYMVGSIDDVRIYNRALSAEEVKALYDLEKPKGK